ncbi:hypothetical protein EB796_003423 [Bugula neritina]|uniref:Uncharacterized protein n=1 Tax=Bugula neritina TaxID=10212 RepID=A0A7J7KHV6_BUGNE|nr:hypothetical protein EB796_003423 [Bugula neritina]
MKTPAPQSSLGHSLLNLVIFPFSSTYRHTKQQEYSICLLAQKNQPTCGNNLQVKYENNLKQNVSEF